jgi:acyl dehydratase
VRYIIFSFPSSLINTEVLELYIFISIFSELIFSIASYFSALFGTKIPGEGCVYVSQSLNFKRPVYINDTIIATVEVIKVDLEKNRVWFKTTCKVNNKIVTDGEAEIYIPKGK